MAQRYGHFAATPQDGALEQLVGLSRLEEGVELLRQHEQLIVKPHEHVMLEKAGSFGRRAARHLIDDEPGTALERQLLPEDDTGTRQVDPKAGAAGRGTGDFRYRQEVRAGGCWWLTGPGDRRRSETDDDGEHEPTDGLTRGRKRVWHGGDRGR